MVKRKLPEVISEAEIQAIIKATRSEKHRLAFALGFYEAMRISEIVALKPENVNKGQKLLLIKQAKGGKDRNIPIAPEVMAGLRHLPIERGVRALQKAFNRYSKLILNKTLNFHLLRHSGASYYLNKKKWDLRSVQRLLGHSKIATTEIYTHVSPEDLVSKMWG